MGCGHSLTEGAQETAVGEVIKPVTVLFADVVGSTKLLETMPPDEAREVITSLLQALSDEVVAEGGTVERLIGDAIMADFGVPIAKEDDPLKAVRAARRMLKRIEETLPQASEVKFQLRIGINTGNVSVGGALGQQLMVMGDAVNVAARLEQAARPGTIVVGERTANSIRSQFELLELGPLLVKGRNEPVQAFSVVKERAVIAGERFHAPMIGRDPQLEDLNETARRTVTDRRAHLVTVIGEPGVGKSRLAREFTKGFIGRARLLEGRCLSSGATLAPLQTILRSEAELLSSDSAEDLLEKIRRFVRQHVVDPAQVEATTAAIALVVGLSEPLRSLGVDDPREVNRRMVEAWRVVLNAMADQASVFVMIEDVHWADDLTLEILDQLLHEVEGPVLFVCTARPDPRLRKSLIPDGSLSDRSTIAVEPLTPTESALLVTHLLDAAEIPSALRERLLTVAGGNPFFIQEILNGLVDAGILQRTDSAWELIKDSEPFDIPPTVRAVIHARLDLLDPASKTFAQRAAVVGRGFWLGAVRELVDRDVPQHVIDDLQRRQLIIRLGRSSIPGEVEFKFKHALIHDAAYETLPRKERGHAHAVAGRWIRDVLGDRVEEAAETLAHHEETAYVLLDKDEHRLEARKFSLLAARNALQRFAIKRAEMFGQKAVALSKRPEERIEAWEALGDLYSLTFKSDGAWDAYRNAIDEGARMKQRVPSLPRLAAKATIVPTRWRGTMGSAPPPAMIDDLIRAGLTAAEPHQLRERSLLAASRSFLLGLSGPEQQGEAERSAKEAVLLAETVDDANLISVALDAVVNFLMPQGRWGEVNRAVRERVALIPRLSDEREICDAYGMAAVAALRIGYFRDAYEYSTQEIEIARGIDAGSYLQGLVWRTSAGFALGDWNGALEDHAEIALLHEQEGEEVPGEMAMRAYVTAMFIRQVRGETDAAGELLELFYRVAETADVRGLPEAALTIARRGSIEDALHWVPMNKDEFLSLHLQAACDILMEVEENGDKARQVLKIARAEIDRAELLALRCHADRLEARVASADGDRQKTMPLLHRSAGGFAELGARWEEARSRLLLAETLIADGSEKAFHDQLRQAHETFEQLGDVGAIRRCRDLSRGIGSLSGG